MKNKIIVNKTFIKKIYSGKKSKNFINLKKKFKRNNIPNNLIFDKDLNIIRLQPNALLLKKNKKLWTNMRFDNTKVYNASSPYQIKRNKYIINNILNIKNIKNIKNILDFGSGDSTFLKQLSLYVKKKTLFGFDKNIKIPNMLLHNKKRIYLLTKKKIKENAPYDLISLNLVISNSYDPWKIFHLCKNLLKNNGYIFVTESNVMLNKKYPRKVNSYFQMKDINLNQFCRPFHYTSLEIINLLELNGFSVNKKILSNKYNFKIFIAKKINSKNKTSLKINNKTEYSQFMNIFFR